MYMIYLFAIVTLFILFGSHWIAARFFISVFAVKKRSIRIGIRLVVLLMPFFFVGNMALLHFWENALTRVLYFIVGIWLAFLINLLLFTLVRSIFDGILKALKKEYSLRAFNRLGFSIIILITLLGIINVFLIGVKAVDVEIKDLPENWQNKKIVQISDVHLGAVLSDSFFAGVVKKVNSLEPDIVVITGDLFDGNNGLEGNVIPQLNSLESKYGTYYVTGNHEVYLDLNKVLHTLKKTNVHILDDELVNLDGLQVIGVSHPEMNETKVFPESIIEVYDEEIPSILLYHLPNNIGGDEASMNDIYFSPDTSFSTAKELGIDLQLSGHTHKGQIFPFNFITSLIYDNFDDGLQETEGFQIYTNTGTGVWGPTMRTSSRPEITLITLK